MRLLLLLATSKLYSDQLCEEQIRKSDVGKDRITDGKWNVQRRSTNRGTRGHCVDQTLRGMSRMNCYTHCLLPVHTVAFDSSVSNYIALIWWVFSDYDMPDAIYRALFFSLYA